MFSHQLRPPTPLPHPARISAVHSENPSTKTFVLDLKWQATPGQFAMVWLPRFDEKPFSLVDDDPVTITVAAVGPFTRLLHQLEPGERMWLRGPFGQGFKLGSARLLGVAGGYGVAPLRFLAKRAHREQAEMTVIVGARSQKDVLFVERLQNAGARVIITTEDGSLGTRGLVTEAVEPLLAAGAADTLYACGPEGMLAALARLARLYRVPAQLSWEAYMRCGMGLCGSCAHDGKVLCLDGPVLPVMPTG